MTVICLELLVFFCFTGSQLRAAAEAKPIQ